MFIADVDAAHFDESVLEQRPATVARLLYDRMERTPDAEAFSYPVGSDWATVTWRQVGERAQLLAAGLIAVGVEPEQRVALASATRYEWVLADLAVMCAGGATTTVYPTTSGSDVAFILSDSASRVVFADTVEQLAKLTERRSELPDVRLVVLFDPLPTDAEWFDPDWVISLAGLTERGAALLAAEPDVLTERERELTGDHLATLIYTSGTTGRPKGVRLTHSAWTYVAAAVDSLGTFTVADKQLLWLPLAHVFGKVMLTIAIQVGHSTAVDGRVDQIGANLATVRPTFMAAAPRVFEKIYAGVNAAGTAGGGAKKAMFSWAIRVGSRVASARRQHASISPTLALQHRLADQLVLSKIRARFGGRLRFFVSGSAPLNVEIAEWFDAIGVPILEGYGLTESSAASLCNRPWQYVFGTVGRPYPGTEVSIADDGEVLLRGPGIMSGYHNQPDETAAVLTADGWFHTGDIGTIDADGLLRITDRKKDLFKTSGGKYVAPAMIESLFKGICPLASQLAIYGEGRRFVSALVTLDPDAVRGWAAAQGQSDVDYATLVTSDAMRATIANYVDQLNARLNPWESVRKFVILDRDLSIDAGELTPSMKLRRRTVTDRFAAELDALYS